MLAIKKLMKAPRKELICCRSLRSLICPTISAPLRLSLPKPLVGHYHTINSAERVLRIRYSSSSSSSVLLEKQWRSATTRLVETEIGTLTPQQMIESAQLIQFWSQLHTEDGTRSAWKLLDRMLREEHMSPQETSESTWTTSLVGTLVNTWAIAPNELVPKDVFSKIKECEGAVPSLWADEVTYTMILDASIKRGDNDSHLLADEILNHLMQGKSPIIPNTILFNTAINAHAKRNEVNAVQRAEELLQIMKDLTNKGYLGVAPDSVTFGTIISTWTNSGKPMAAKRAEELLMESPEPQSSTFNAVIHAWARSEGTDAQYSIERSLAIFDFMKMQYKSGQSQAMPNAITYGTIIGLLAKGGKAKEAENCMMELVFEYENSLHSELAPSRILFNSLIDAWSRSRDRDAPRRVNTILRKMQQIATETGAENIKPDVVTFTLLLQTLAMSRDVDAAPQAEAILKHMWDLYAAGDDGAKPNTRTCNKVLDCWLYVKSNEMAHKAEALLRNMQKHSKSGDINLQPDTTTYVLVVDMWSKSRAPEAPERVESLLEEIEHLSSDPTAPVSLNKILFNMAIITWSRSGRKESLERAEHLFRRACSLGEAGWEDMQPNTGVYNAMLAVLAKSRDPASKDKADYYLSQLKKRYNGGDLNCKPTTITYSTYLDVLSNSRERNRLPKIESILADMKSMGYGPDQITFNCIIKCLSRTPGMDNTELAWGHVYKIEQEYDLKATTRTLNEALAACANCDKFDQETRERAFGIAVKIFRRIVRESEPDAFSFQLFFSAVAGLNYSKEVKMAWTLCCRHRLQNDPLIVRALQRTAPYLLL